MFGGSYPHSIFVILPLLFSHAFSAFYEYNFSGKPKCLPEDAGTLEVRHKAIGFRDFAELTAHGKTINECNLFFKATSPPYKLVIEIGEPWTELSNNTLGSSTSPSLTVQMRFSAWEPWSMAYKFPETPAEGEARKSPVISFTRGVWIKFENPSNASVTFKIAIRPSVGLPVLIPPWMTLTVTGVVVAALMVMAIFIRIYCPNPNRNYKINKACLKKKCCCCCTDSKNDEPSENNESQDAEGTSVPLMDEGVVITNPPENSTEPSEKV